MQRSSLEMCYIKIYISVRIPYLGVQMKDLNCDLFQSYLSKKVCCVLVMLCFCIAVFLYGHIFTLQCFIQSLVFCV